MRRRVGRATFAGVVSAVTATLVLATGCSSSDNSGVSAKVEVDIYSGQENPEFGLSTRASEDLREFVERRMSGAEAAKLPEGSLGFRGFVVTFYHPSDDWSQVRVVREVVYVDNGRDTLRIVDEANAAFEIVLGDIRGRLDAAVIDAIEDAD